MIETIYSIFRFLFEILSVGIIGYWGFSLKNLHGWRYIIGIAAPLLIVVVWATWGAPSSAYRLAGIARLALELGIYLIATLCLVLTGHRQIAVVFGIVGLANGITNHLMQIQI